MSLRFTDFIKNLYLKNIDKYRTLLICLYYQHQYVHEAQFYGNLVFTIYRHPFKNILRWIYLYADLVLKIYYRSSYFYSY